MTRNNTDGAILPDVLYEDNHLIAVNKRPSDIVQGDRTGDVPLSEQVAEYIAAKYEKPGKAFIGVTHRIDRPVSGVVLFARTSKALARINQMFRENTIRKTYWAVVSARPPQTEGELTNHLLKHADTNKSVVVSPGKGKEAITRYKLLLSSDRYHLLEVKPLTGRHHQIRVQLAHMGCPIKGDLKYGAKRSNQDASIHLHARSIHLEHPVRKDEMEIVAPPPSGDPLWQFFTQQLQVAK